MQNILYPTLYIYSDSSDPCHLSGILAELKIEYKRLNQLSEGVGLLLLEEPDRLSDQEQETLMERLDSQACLVLAYFYQEPKRFNPDLLSHPSLVCISGELIPWQLLALIQSLSKRFAQQKQKQDYELLFQQVGLGVAKINSLTGRFIQINKKYLDIMGYSDREMTQLSYHDISYHEDLDEDLESMQALLAGDIKDFSMDKRLVRKNGEIFWVHLTVAAMPVPGKRLETHIAIVQDIHQQKMAEIYHIEAELRFRQMFEKHDSIMLLINPVNGQIIDANHSAVRFYGYSRAQLRQMMISEINQMDASSVVSSLQQAYTQEKNTFYFEHRLADGQIRSVEVHSTPIMVQQKELLFSIIHDITSRKQAEQALLKSESRYRQIVETAEEGIWMIDANNITTFVNQKMADLLGFQFPFELIGASMYDFIDTDNIAYANANIERRKTGLAETHDFELLRANGVRIWTSMATSPIYDVSGVYQGALAMVTDISERKRSEVQLQKNLDERELLLREVHHRVKNNFQMIMSMLNLQSRKARSHSEINQLLAAKERIRSMALVHEALYHADDMAQLNLADYLKQLVRELLSGKQDKRKVDISFDLSRVYLEINPSISFALLAYELIANVFQHAFLPEHQVSPELSIRLTPQGNEIYLEIVDNGTGFSRALFDSGDETLGFQLVKQLSRQLDARLELNSDLGTHWRVIIPFH